MTLEVGASRRREELLGVLAAWREISLLCFVSWRLCGKPWQPMMPMRPPRVRRSSAGSRYRRARGFRAARVRAIPSAGSGWPRPRARRVKSGRSFSIISSTDSEHVERLAPTITVVGQRSCRDVVPHVRRRRRCSSRPPIPACRQGAPARRRDSRRCRRRYSRARSLPATSETRRARDRPRTSPPRTARCCAGAAPARPSETCGRRGPARA